MGEQSRRHHYVPILHLAGFLADGADELAIFDKQTSKSWWKKPERCAFERDLYLLELEGHEWTDAMEQALSVAESNLAPTLRKLIAERKLPLTHTSMANLLRFVALATFRTPAAIKNFSEINHEMAVREMVKMVASGEWDVKYEARYGRQPDPAETKEMVTMMRAGDLRCVLSQNALMELMMKAVNEVGPSLAFRHWHLLIAKDTAPDFICTDNPAILSVRKPELFPTRFVPGISTPHTWLVFPLCRRLALIGSLENNHPRGPADTKQVAFINRLLIDGAERFLISATPDIAWQEGRHVFGTKELIERLDSERRREKR